MESNDDPDSKYLHNIENVKFSPIFIMGLHRSGTSILYQMLRESGNFNVVTAYHILKYDELLYNHINHLEKKIKNDMSQFFKNQGIKTRMTDHISVSPDFAQEYKFLFIKKYYQCQLQPENLWLFEELCKKVQYISVNDKPILLKNPYDFANFLFIKEKYPNSKFIFILRNPMHVISSDFRGRRYLYERKNPYTSLFVPGYNFRYDNPLLLHASRIYYGPLYPIVLMKIIKKTAEEINKFLNKISYMRKSEYIIIKYEDLCSEPNSSMSNIFTYLGLKNNMDFRKFIQPRNLDIMPEVRKMQKIISGKMQVFNELFGYD